MQTLEEKTVEQRLNFSMGLLQSDPSTSLYILGEIVECCPDLIFERRFNILQGLSRYNVVNNVLYDYGKEDNKKLIMLFTALGDESISYFEREIWERDFWYEMSCLYQRSEKYYFKERANRLKEFSCEVFRKIGSKRALPILENIKNSRTREGKKFLFYTPRRIKKEARRTIQAISFSS